MDNLCFLSRKINPRKNKITFIDELRVGGWLVWRAIYTDLKPCFAGG